MHLQRHHPADHARTQHIQHIQHVSIFLTTLRMAEGVVKKSAIKTPKMLNMLNMLKFSPDSADGLTESAHSIIRVALAKSRKRLIIFNIFNISRCFCVLFSALR